MYIVIIDNFDSFTYNLVHIVEQYCQKYTVMRNNNINWQQLDACDKIIFSPGPGIPSEVEVMGTILNKYASTKSIFGVCLGMQYICEYFGAELINLKEIVHGIPKTTIVVDNSTLLFQNISSPFQSGRYHSWAVSPNNFPDCLKITAIDKEHTIMAIQHSELNICGVQFHPESILTEQGELLIKNWIENKIHCN